MHAIADLSHRQQNQNFATPVARSADEKVQR